MRNAETGLSAMCRAFAAEGRDTGDHIIRPMGAATMKIATDTQPGRLTVAIECAAGHCHGIDSVTEDIAGTLALEASDQHFKSPAAAWVWTSARIGDLSPA